MKEVLRRFWPYMRDYKLYFFFALVGVVMVAAGTAGITYMIKPIMDEIFVNKDETLFYVLPALLVGIYTLKGFGRFVQAYFTVYIGQSIIRRVRGELLGTLLKMDMAFFNRTQKGVLMSRITNDTSRIQSVVSDAIPLILRESLTIVALLGVVIYHSPKLAFFALVVMPMAAYPLSILIKKMKRISRSSQEKIADITARLTEIFNNVEMVKANTTERFECERFEKDNEKFFRLAMKATKTNELVNPLMEILGAIGGAVVVIVGGHEVLNGTMTVGTFFSFIAALFMLFTPIKMITSYYNRMQDAVVAAERVFEFLDLRPEIKPQGKLPVERIDTVRFENVILNYEEKTALKGIDLEANLGETVALVGDSGGGKTSLVNLLVRFYDVSGGQLLINGTDIREYNLESLRQNIAFVTQRVFIFNDTIAANVAYGLEINEEQVVHALKEANAWEFVSELPEGIHTVLDEAGVNLSGGQRQRISIARAIYKNPKLLILDEATSALDNKSEALIQEAFERLRHGRITFVIAHRLSTVKDAEKIAVLRHGKVVCMDREEVLSRECPEYQRLKANNQF